MISVQNYGNCKSCYHRWSRRLLVPVFFALGNAGVVVVNAYTLSVNRIRQEKAYFPSTRARSPILSLHKTGDYYRPIDIISMNDDDDDDDENESDENIAIGISSLVRLTTPRPPPLQNNHDDDDEFPEEELLKGNVVGDDFITIVWAGTKRGEVYEIITSKDVPSSSCYEDKSENDDWCVEHVKDADDITNTGTKQKTVNYPIYSMAQYYYAFQDVQYIFCGCGDRYIQVWKQKKNAAIENSSSSNSRRWQKTQRLGPHTGWVKDLYVEDYWNADCTTPRLFSIGCNCIEVWGLLQGGSSSSNDDDEWHHQFKLSIESSVSQGATLSSDLLCLCGCACANYTENNEKKKKKKTHQAPNSNNNNNNNNLLAAGGVDGRIHVWELNKISSSRRRHCDPQLSFPAHTGRINAMVYEKSTNSLFSASHDGKIKCWTLTENSNNNHQNNNNNNDIEDGISVSEMAEFSINTETRITALTMILSSSCHDDDDDDDSTKLSTSMSSKVDNTVTLACGTHNGRIYLVKYCPKSMKFTLLKQSSIPEDPFVYCLMQGRECSFQFETAMPLLVGHSKGIGIVS